MNTCKLTGKVLFRNLLTPQKFMGSKAVDNPNGDYNLTITVEDNHKDYLKFLEVINSEKKRIMESSEYRKYTSQGNAPQIMFQDKPHTTKDGTLVDGFRQVKMKRAAINSKGEKAMIKFHDKYGKEISIDRDPSFGSKVQVAFGLGDHYIAKDNTWYITFYLLAVLIEEEATSSYGFDVAEPDIADTMAENFGAEQVPFEGETPPPITEEELPF